MDTATRVQAPPSLQAQFAALDDLWGALDALLAGLRPGDWARRHGKDWRFADIPYHLAYFDREMIARNIARGTAVPLDEQHTFGSLADIGKWNERYFAQRPASQTPTESMAQMRASRELIRRVIAELGDSAGERPAWSWLPGCGWLTVQGALESCIGHTWSHLTEARLRLNRPAPPLQPATIHQALHFYLTRVFPATVNRAQASDRPFILALEMTGAGGGSWAVEVSIAAVSAREEPPDRPSFVMTQSPETFIKTLTFMHNPLIAMLTGRIKIKGLGRMGEFAKLFPPPNPKSVFSPSPRMAAPA